MQAIHIILHEILCDVALTSPTFRGGWGVRLLGRIAAVACYGSKRFTSLKCKKKPFLETFSCGLSLISFHPCCPSLPHFKHGNSTRQLNQYYEQPISILSDFWPYFFADAPVNQNKTVSKVNFSIIHLVRTVCELTSSIIQTHYTRTTLFSLHLRKSFSIEDRKTLSPKAMHPVCCCRWCWRVLFWTVVVWSEFVSLVLCILPPLRWFHAATYHRQLPIHNRHIRRWRSSIRFRMQNPCLLV